MGNVVRWFNDCAGKKFQLIKTKKFKGANIFGNFRAFVNQIFINRKAGKLD